MKYEELRKFIINEMRPDKAHGDEKNYQPVVIRFLNQTLDGIGERNEIIAELQKENPDREITSGTLKTVTDTLIRNKVIEPKGNSFALLDFESYKDHYGEKAEITKRCDERIKESAQDKVPFYLLFRHKSEDNPYEDDPSGKVYHFPKIANYTKVVPGAKAIWYDKINGTYYFWGYGTISQINPRPERDFDAIFDDFTLFEKESDSLEKHGKFLKKATPEVEEMIQNRPTFNVQHSISEIDIEIFDKIVGSSHIERTDSLMIGHKLFLIEMKQKEHKIPFTHFNHVDFVNEEVDYKKIALGKSLTELSLDKWNEWISTPEKICQAVRNAVAQKISRNLIWAPPFNTEIGYFDELDDTSKVEFGKYFYDLFKGSDSIEKRYDDFVISLEKIKRKQEPRLLAYLMFLFESDKYFPIHPTNFDNLLEFYGFEKIKEVSWKKYSQYLELASKLKPFLSKQFPDAELTSLQIQSYMWVIAGAVSKNYWMIRPGVNGEDWENQRNTKLVGIHYYTIDLSKYASPNNQLTKRKLHDKMQELRKAEGKEPDSQPALNADFGQFERIFAIRKKDKIVTISNNSTLLGIGNATDRYKFRTDVSRNCHTVPVDWYDVESRQIPKQEIRRTIKKLDIKDYVDIMSSQETIQKSKYEKFFNILNKKKQFFFYGPPGTGKTFTAKEIAREFIKESYTKSFSDDQYSEYVLSMINKISNENGFELEKQTDNNLIIKNSKKELRLYINYSKSGKNTPHDCYVGISKSVIDFLNQTDEENRFVLIINNDMKNFLILPHSFIIKNVKLSGGENWDSNGIEDHSFHVHVYDDKSQFRANDEYSENYVDCSSFLSNIEILFNKDGKPCNKLEKVTFHQSFSYEEFIEGIRPKTDEKMNQITYPIEDGIFKRLCKCASVHNKENFVLIIDEINRGNISKIFGELITLLENDKRGDQVTLPYSKKLFSVPENLYVIGTMNTADRSLVHIDAALKRRFGQYEMMPDNTLLDAKIERVHLGNLLVLLNKKIIKAKFRDNQIGHSYFMKDAKPITTVEELQFAFAYDIVPLLKDNFYDDDKILHSILGNELIDEDRNIISEWTEDESIFMKILEKVYPEAFD